MLESYISKIKILHLSLIKYLQSQQRRFSWSLSW